LNLKEQDKAMPSSFSTTNLYF